MTACFRIAAIAVRELIHERVFYLLACFLLLSLGMSLILGQMTYAEQAKLTLDFMLAGTQASMVLFSIFMGISLFHRELNQGSISMILSKPIPRASFLVGKYLGQLTVQTLAIFFMGAITLAFSARFESFVSVTAVIQTLLMFTFEVSVLTAVTYFFAVNAGGITTAVATICIFLMGHVRETVGKNLNEGSDLSIWGAVKAVTPDFEVFNMKALASYGQSIGWAEFGWAALYAACCACFFLLLATICFERKDIVT